MTDQDAQDAAAFDRGFMREHRRAVATDRVTGVPVCEHGDDAAACQLAHSYVQPHLPGVHTQPVVAPQLVGLVHVHQFNAAGTCVEPIMHEGRAYPCDTATEPRPVTFGSGAETYSTLAELRAAPADPDRDARREAYRADQRRKAARALDRLFDLTLPPDAAPRYSTAASERFVEAVGDYVLSRLHHNSHYGVTNERAHAGGNLPCDICGGRCTIDAGCTCPAPCAMHSTAHKRNYGAGPDLYCASCGHPASWHRLDDATNLGPADPNAKFRCIGYDCTTDGPIGSCAAECPDYVKPHHKAHYGVADRLAELPDATMRIDADVIGDPSLCKRGMELDGRMPPGTTPPEPNCGCTNRSDCRWPGTDRLPAAHNPDYVATEDRRGAAS